MTEVAKTTPQISEFILSPLLKHSSGQNLFAFSHMTFDSEVKTPLQREKILAIPKIPQAPKLDLKTLFDDCFYNVKLEKTLEDQPPKKDDEFQALFQAKKTICK
jgi:hypothetical protein